MILVLLRQHLRGDVAFSDVYELKEEVGQTTTSVCRRCLHRVTAVEYSVKVADPGRWTLASPPDLTLVPSEVDRHLFAFASDHREGEEGPVRGDRDPATIRSTPQHY